MLIHIALSSDLSTAEHSDINNKKAQGTRAGTEEPFCQYLHESHPQLSPTSRLCLGWAVIKDQSLTGIIFTALRAVPCSHTVVTQCSWTCCCFQHDGHYIGLLCLWAPCTASLGLFSVYFGLDTSAFDFLLHRKGYSQFLCACFFTLPSLCSFQEAILSQTLQTKPYCPASPDPLPHPWRHPEACSSSQFYICCMPCTMPHHPSPRLLSPRRPEERRRAAA